MELRRFEEGLRFEREIPEVSEVIRFEATDISMSNGRPHAQISIFKGLPNKGRLLAYTYLSLMRDEERVRLSNSAYRMLEGDAVLTSSYLSLIHI